MALIFALFGFLVLFAGITYTLYWYDTANGPELERLRRVSQERIPGWVFRGFLWAVAAQITAVLTFPLGWIPRRKAVSHPAGGSDPIVVPVHGLYHNRSAFLLLERALKRSGIHDVRPWSYSSWNKEFFQLADSLRRYLEELHGSAPSRPILLVGHSLGGLLARYAAATCRKGVVSGCLSLGTPHQGSRLAVFALGALGKSLGYRSPLIETLEREENRRPAPEFPCVALVSPVDNMVLPTASLIPPAQHWQVQWTPPMSHVAMLYHPAVLRAVVSWVKEASPQNRTRTA